MKTNLTEPKWHVVYTKPKTERKVASSISELGLEAFLPLQKVQRKWSDRIKKMEVPLFPNYVFVKVDDVKRVHLFSIKEMVRFVSFDKKPVVIRENEITTIKRILKEEVDVAVEEYFQTGLKVKIVQGHFAGLEGTIIRRSGKTRLLIKIDALVKAFSVDVPCALIDMAR